MNNHDIKVGSQWVSKKLSYAKYIVESVDASNNRVNWTDGGFDWLDTLRNNYKEVVAADLADLLEATV